MTLSLDTSQNHESKSVLQSHFPLSLVMTTQSLVAYSDCSTKSRINIISNQIISLIKLYLIEKRFYSRAADVIVSNFRLIIKNSRKFDSYLSGICYDKLNLVTYKY